MISRAAAAVAVFACAVSVAACGSSTSVVTTGRLRGSPTAAEIAVVKGWSQALRRGDVDGAASYFAVPSVFVNGFALQVRSVADARLANRTLSCGARYVSARVRGRYLEAVFVLTGRSGPGGTSCTPGVGERAGVAFLFSHGKITAWLRLASASTPTVPTVPTPSAPTTPAPDTAPQGTPSV